MYKILRHIVRITALVAIISMFVPWHVMPAFAESTVTIAGPNSVEAGQTFTVTVKFKGDNIGRVDGGLTYDDSVVSYVSGGTSSGDGGYVELKDGGIGGDIVFNLKFKGIKGGSSSLKVSTDGVYNLEEEYMNAPKTSMNVTVNAAQTTEQTTESSSYSEETTTITETTPTEEESGFPMMYAVIAAIVTLLLVALVAFAIRRSNRRGRHSRR